MLTRLPTNWSQWLGAVLGSVLVGLAGVLPLAVVPASKVGGGAVSEDSLKYLLGFAAGGLLGDVFLHLLPETYQHVRLINAVYKPSSLDIWTLVIFGQI